MRIALRAAFAAALCIACAPLASQAQNYPSKPIRIVVGFPPGGGNDIIARLVGAKLSESWGQSVVIDNKPGANAIIATEFVAKAAPDGHTLLVGASGAMTVNPGLYAKLPYDPEKDFAPVTLMGSFPLFLVVNPSVPAQSVRDLVALAKAKPGTLAFSSGSTPFQLAAELLKLRTGTQLNFVPYKGSAQAINAVIAGDVAMTFVDSTPVVAQVRSGRLRALAVTSPRRSPALPEVPTMTEAGLPDSDVVLWSSLFAPAGTPPAIVNRLAAEVARIVQLPDVKEKMLALGTDPVGNTPAELAAIMRADIARWGGVIRAAGIKPE